MDTEAARPLRVNRRDVHPTAKDNTYVYVLLVKPLDFSVRKLIVPLGSFPLHQDKKAPARCGWMFIKATLECGALSISLSGDT